MAKTYEIVCHDCKVTLWIGQDTRLYTTPAHLKQQQDFFYGHIGHRLEFNDSDTLMALDEYTDLSDYGDET